MPCLLSAQRPAQTSRKGRRTLKREESGCSSVSTRAPSSVESSAESDSSEPVLPPAKRRSVQCKAGAVAATTPQRRVRRKAPHAEAWQMCRVEHQLSLVGKGYDTKATRLQQMLQRIPADGSSSVLVFAEASSGAAVEAALLQHEQEALAAGSGQVLVEMVVGRVQEFQEGPTMFTTVVNYDAPTTAAEYARRAQVALTAASACGSGTPAVVATFITEQQRHGHDLDELRRLLESTRRLALAEPFAGGPIKAAAIDSALLYFVREEEEEEEDEEGGAGHSEDCDCTFCQSQAGCTLSYHFASPRGICPTGSPPAVEVVTLPIRALEDMASLDLLIAPRLRHTCTIICLHNMYQHDPWHGFEHLFALPPAMGPLRVVRVLATGGSWHHYPDVGTFSGGTPWMSILDMDTMDASDRLLEKLEEHELGLLQGRGERLVLMGSSQGGGQTLLRFIRSRHRLGGWVGSVCHAPTAPHTPRDRDPLAALDRPCVNLDRPMRVLSGGLDTTFPVAMVQRDFRRLQQVGGFTDVGVTVMPDLTHDGPDTGSPAMLPFLQELMPAILAEPAGEASHVCRQ